MLDIQVRGQPARGVLPPVEFLRIELLPLAEGRVLVSMTATSLDEHDARLLDQEIASDKVAKVEDVLSLIRRHVAFVSRPRHQEH